MGGDNLKFGTYSVVDISVPENKKKTAAVGNEVRLLILGKMVLAPKTVAQLADEIDLSRQSISKHIEVLLEAGLIKEVEPNQKRYVMEKYYDLAIPAILLSDKERLYPVFEAIAQEAIESYKKPWKEMEKAFKQTSMAQKGWKIEDLMPWILTEISEYVHSLLMKEVRGITKEGKMGFFMIYEYKDTKESSNS